MSFGTQAGADRRVLISAALIGSGVGLTLGAAYLAGGMARAAHDHVRAERVARFAAGDFSEAVLARETIDPGVLRVALAHDPKAGVGGPEDSLEHQVQLLADRLNARAADPDAMQQARDLDCLTDAVYYEARGESRRGRQAVATVVLNRVKNRNYPKTVCGVVFQRASGGCQFSFACDGSMQRRREPRAWDDARNIAARALSGYVLRDIGSATHFHTTQVSPDWAPKMLRVTQVGLHVFYRFNPHAHDVPAVDTALEPQQAVFTSAPTKEPPPLRLAAAIAQKPEVVPAPAVQTTPVKDPKALVKAVPAVASSPVKLAVPQAKPTAPDTTAS